MVNWPTLSNHLPLKANILSHQIFILLVFWLVLSSQYLTGQYFVLLDIHFNSKSNCIRQPPTQSLDWLLQCRFDCVLENLSPLPLIFEVGYRGITRQLVGCFVWTASIGPDGLQWNVVPMISIKCGCSRYTSGFKVQTQLFFIIFRFGPLGLCVFCECLSNHLQVILVVGWIPYFPLSVNTTNMTDWMSSVSNLTNPSSQYQ